MKRLFRVLTLASFAVCIAHFIGGIPGHSADTIQRCRPRKEEWAVGRP